LTWPSAVDLQQIFGILKWKKQREKYHIPYESFMSKEGLIVAKLRVIRRH